MFWGFARRAIPPALVTFSAILRVSCAGSLCAAAIALSKAGPVGLEFLGRLTNTATPEKEQPGRVNYIFGNDQSRRRLGLPTFERATYRDLYPDIDVAYYGNLRQLEFDFILKPAADPGSTLMRLDDPEGTAHRFFRRSCARTVALMTLEVCSRRVAGRA